ncbi:MAG: hypothetical protein AB7S78_13285 [Candidatus Omnitrophota bacterium]
MKKSLLRIPFISGLIISLLGFSIYCCCFQDIVEAKPQLPPCHQTAPQPDQPQNNQECNCHKNILANDTVSVKGIDFSKADLFIVNAVVAAFKPVTLVKLFNYPESPPGVGSAIPLYIKHSVFRL